MHMGDRERFLWDLLVFLLEYSPWVVAGLFTVAVALLVVAIRRRRR